MILPAKYNANKISKQLFNEEDDISSDDICSDDSDGDEICDHKPDGDDEEGKEQKAEMQLKGWSCLLPPVEESNGKKVCCNLQDEKMLKIVYR